MLLPVAGASTNGKPGLAAAVRYEERPAAGPRAGAAIDLGPAGNGPYVIDSLSAVEICFDRPRLAEWLAKAGALPDSERTGALNRRAAALRNAIAAMQRVTTAALRAFGSGDPQAARRTIAEMGRTNAELLRAIRDVRAERLRPLLGPRAKERAERDLESALIDEPPGYDWQRLQALVAEELAALYGELLDETRGIEVDVQAHVLHPPGLAHALYLPGYNEALVGPLKPTSKVRFLVPPGTGAALEAIGSIAHAIESAATAREALERQLRAELRARRVELRRLLEGVREARERAAESIAALESWVAALAPERAGATLRRELESLPGYADLARAARDTRADLALLAALGELDRRLENLPPDRALAELLGVFDRLSGPDRYRALRPAVWRERAAIVERFASGLPSALRARLEEESRRFVAATARATSALEHLGDEIAALPDAGRRLVVRALGLTAVPPPGNLPPPPGRLLRPVSSELDTRFDLRSAPFEIEDDDQVLLEIRLRAQGAPLADGTLRDLFVAREFGLSSRIVASLAFARQDVPGATWRPAPAASWILHWRGWPRDRAAAGASHARHRFGIGLSALSLDFDSGESVEVGLALTAAVFDDRVLAGYGTDLHAARDRGFWFFSVRLFRYGDPLR